MRNMSHSKTSTFLLITTHAGQLIAFRHSRKPRMLERDSALGPDLEPEFAEY